MNTTIPNLRSASLFVANHDDVCDPVRIVDVYELEYHIADGGISKINGVYHHIRKGTIIIAKPGDKIRMCPVKEAIEPRCRLDGRTLFIMTVLLAVLSIVMGVIDLAIPGTYIVTFKNTTFKFLKR